MAKASFLDVDVSGRAALAFAYLAVQGALLATAGQRPDGVFSFQMFNESSTIAIQLGRRVTAPDGGTTVVATDGGWETGDGRGGTRIFRWTDRVKDPTLAALGRPVHAAYGVAAQLFRLQHALDDVAEHLDGDVATRALVADVSIRRNGREPYETRLESRARFP